MTFEDMLNTAKAFLINDIETTNILADINIVDLSLRDINYVFSIPFLKNDDDFDADFDDCNLILDSNEDVSQDTLRATKCE
jgi:hypothetical protein